MAQTVSAVKTGFFDINRNMARLLDPLNLRIPQKRVMLKPNIVANHSSRSGIITPWQVTAALILYLKERFTLDEIVIAESCAVHQSLKNVLSHTGYLKIKKRYGVDILDINDLPKQELQWPSGKIRIPQLLSTHYYVNLANMKTHIQTMVSLCTKNQKGLLEAVDKKDFHKKALDQSIYDFGHLVNPDLNILTAIISIEGNGPLDYGKKRRDNFMLASTHLLSIDNAALKIMAIDPSEVEHIENFSDFKMIGDNIKIRPFKKPGEYFRKYNIFVHPFNSCSYCPIVLRNVLSPSLSNLKIIPKLLKAGVFSRKDIVLGDGDMPPGAKNIICVGSCSRKFAERHNLPLIKGCPPSEDQIFRALNNKR